MKRFWDTAAAVPDPVANPGGYRVVLDGKPVRLPGGGPLLVRPRTLAEAIAAEWAAAGGAKGGEMTPADIPLTRLAGTAQERIAPNPAPMVEGLAKYAETDLLCYRAEDRRLAATRPPSGSRCSTGRRCSTMRRCGSRRADAGAAGPRGA